MKNLTAILLALCLLPALCAGCAEKSASSDAPKESSSSSFRSDLLSSAPEASAPESEAEGSDPPESPASGEDLAPDPEPQPSPSESEMVEPPAVPHGADLDGVDFSVMDKDELVELLQPVLDRAGFFCKLGWMDRLDSELGIKVDFSPEEAIEVPVQGFDFNKSLYPCLNLPYQTVEELRQDIGTVFTPDVSEEHLQIIFNHYIDHEGRLYVEGGGYSVHRNWKLDEMAVVAAGENKLTISAPVSVWGPSSDEFFTASLSFEIIDGYIIMDSSYFATDAS